MSRATLILSSHSRILMRGSAGARALRRRGSGRRRERPQCGPPSPPRCACWEEARKEMTAEAEPEAAAEAAPPLLPFERGCERGCLPMLGELRRPRTRRACRHLRLWRTVLARTPTPVPVAGSTVSSSFVSRTVRRPPRGALSARLCRSASRRSAVKAPPSGERGGEREAAASGEREDRALHSPVHMGLATRQRRRLATRRRRR
mmetsp:Transcript_18978/g.60622  ORF Transcript_18978/g.60622 Transcript_18978/m.60622 type:complete len:204 (-) Transcript_18978:596-1207(-)